MATFSVNMVLTATLLVIAFLSYIHEKVIYNPLTLFCSMWAIIFFLASFSLYGMIGAKQRTYYLMFLGILSFTLGWLLKKALPTIKLRAQMETEEIHQRAVRILLVLSLIYSAIHAVDVLQKLLQGYSYTYIRKSFLGYDHVENMFLNHFDYLLYQLVVRPTNMVLYIILMIDTIKNKSNTFWFVLAFANVVINAFYSGGRFILLYCLAASAVALMIYKISVPKKIKRVLGGIGIAVIVGMFVITLFRGLGSSTTGRGDIFKSIYVYLTLPVPFFEYSMEIFDGNFTHGMMSCFGILDLLAQIVENLFGVEMEFIQRAHFIFDSKEQYVTHIFANTHINAFTSLFYYFYVDFGVPGIIGGSILFGGMCNSVFERAKNTDNIYAVAMLLYFMEVILLTMSIWPFARMSSVLPVFYIRLLIGKRSIHEIKPSLRD